MSGTLTTSVKRTPPPNDPIGTEYDSVGIELSILMPCLNEAETLSSCIRKALRFLLDNKVRGEVVVADNGSTD